MKTESTGEAPDRDFVTALARGLQVIQAFGAESPEMTLSEVAQRTGLNVATVRRSLITLEQLGYVRRRERRFVLGPKVLTLGASYLESMNLKEVAQHHLIELVERFHDAASLTVLDGFEVVYIAHVPSDQRVRHGRSVGSRLPAHATSTGLVLLAHGPAAQREQLLAAAPLAAYTSRTPTTAKELRSRFAHALKDDHVVAADTIEYGAIALAVPVRDAQGRVVAALNCATTTRLIDEAGIVATRLEPLREAARKIGHMLDRYPALAHSVSA
jgi:IclR family pca regulon transcriptional regulator